MEGKGRVGVSGQADSIASSTGSGATGVSGVANKADHFGGFFTNSLALGPGVRGRVLLQDVSGKSTIDEGSDSVTVTPVLSTVSSFQLVIPTLQSDAGRPYRRAGKRRIRELHDFLDRQRRPELHRWLADSRLEARKEGHARGRKHLKGGDPAAARAEIGDLPGVNLQDALTLAFLICDRPPPAAPARRFTPSRDGHHGARRERLGQRCPGGIRAAELGPGSQATIDLGGTKRGRRAVRPRRRRRSSCHTPPGPCHPPVGSRRSTDRVPGRCQRRQR